MASSRTVPKAVLRWIRVKFNDRNNNGQWDEGEEGLPGWEIVLDLDQDGTGDRTTTTNRWGEYSFMDLPAGTFDLWEVQQPGWVQTMPEGGIHIPNIQIREIQRHFHFGNHLTAAEIHGRKYNDLNNSGGWDEGEPFLEGWEIALDLNNDGTADTVTTTNEFGAYWFMDLPNGPFTLWEVVQEGWAVTEPASGMHTGDLNAGDILRGMLFGNYQSGPALPDLTITLGALRGCDDVSEPSRLGSDPLRGWLRCLRNDLSTRSGMAHTVPTASASSDLIGAWPLAPSQSCPLTWPASQLLGGGNDRSRRSSR